MPHNLALQASQSAHRGLRGGASRVQSLAAAAAPLLPRRWVLVLVLVLVRPERQVGDRAAACQSVPGLPRWSLLGCLRARGWR